MPVATKTLPRRASVESVLPRLLAFDRKYRFPGRCRTAKCLLIGVDEVGRGCLAGPVVAAAVILPEIILESDTAKALSALNDSKKLLPSQREQLSQVIEKIAIFAIGEASHQEINEINILHASLLAMQRAVNKLSQLTDLEQMPTLVLIDGNKKTKELTHIQEPVVNGDNHSASIAAASIVAKVYRDRFMTELSQSFPAFAWHQNKGYSSPTHVEALRMFGMTPWHRLTFCEKYLNDEITL